MITPTEEQVAIIEAAKRTKDNLLISALAGAAKTSTLVMVAENVLTPTFCGAFNKKIADEMGKRLPGHVMSLTMNSIGHRTWGAAVGKRLVVNTDKVYTGLKEYVDGLRPAGRKEVNENFAAILRGVRLAKSAGYIPEKARSMGNPIVDEGEFQASLYRQVDCELDEAFLAALDHVLNRGIAESYSGLIDFDDQIYMSTLFGGNYPKFPLVMIDEAQDLSPLNHLTVSKLVGQRLIAVGDPNQAIYGFRGAHTSSMSVMKEQFSMTELPLSVSFRCPQAVVRHAQTRVPHMRWPEWAVEGKVERLAEWTAAEIPDQSAIICRNNAPLFACAMRLLRAGRGVHIVGNDVGAGLVKLMKKLAPETVSQEAFTAKIDQWQQEELRKTRNSRHASINDRAECLRVFAEFGEDSKEAILYAEHLFNTAGPIQMMTGHKAKGLEFDVVYHLNRFLVPSKWAKAAAENGDSTQLEQEYNLRYVIETRAKRELYFIDLEDMQ